MTRDPHLDATFADFREKRAALDGEPYPHERALLRQAAYQRMMDGDDILGAVHVLLGGVL